MKKNNYLKVWQTLTKEEAKQFSHYLQAFFSKQKVSIQLHDYFFSKREKAATEMEDIYQAVFKQPIKQASDKKKVSNGLSDLYLHLKNFLIQRQALQADFEKDFLWLQVLENKKLHRLRELHIKKMRKTASEIQAPDIWHPLQSFRLMHHNYFRNDRNKTDNFSYEEMLSAVDDFYISARFRLGIEVMNAQNTIGTYHVSDLDNALFDYVKEKKELSTLNRFYFSLHAFKKKLKPTQEDAQVFFNFLKSKQDQLPHEEQLICLINLVNFWAKAIRNKVSGADRKVLDLYKFGIDNNILIYKDTIDEAVFNNIVSVACMQKEFNWANDFVNKYSSFLPLNIQKNTLHISKASIAICLGKNQQVIKLLNQIDVDDDLQHLRWHSLYIRALYHLQMFSKVQDKCENFIKFVRRRKLPQATVDATVNFARLLKQFINVNNTGSTLETKTHQTSPLFCKDWFLEEAAKR